MEFPRILKHLQNNYLEVSGTFSPLFMTLFVYMTPFDVATKLFELFIIDGELVLIRVLLKMIELKQK
jgi:Rab-GTPase-TBC domain